MFFVENFLLLSNLYFGRKVFLKLFFQTIAYPTFVRQPQEQA